MSLEPSAQIEGGPAGVMWTEIESALEELSGLAKSSIAAEELRSRLLARLVGVLGAVGGLVWKLEAGEGLQIECQMSLGEALGGDANELARHRRLAESVAASGQARMVPAAFRDGEIANASPCLAILCPIAVDQQPIAVVELFLRPETRSAVLEGYSRLMRTACEIVEEYHRARALGESRRREGELVELIKYLDHIHRSLDLRTVAAAIANEARRLIDCDRVTVLTKLGARLRVVAISGVESFDRRSGVVQGLESLAKSVVSSEQAVWVPEQVDDLPPQVAEQVQSLLDESHAKGMGLVPVQTGAEDAEATVGMLVVERFAASFGVDDQRRTIQITKASSAPLANALTYDQIPLRRVLQPLAAVLGLAPGQRRSPVAAGAGVLLAVGAALCLIPADFTVEARGEAMPRRRQQVFAPSDGVVVELACADGERVKRGQVLAKLHSPQIDIDESELLGKSRTVQEELVATETASLRSELEPSGTMGRGQHTARVLQLKEELRGLEAQLQIVRQQQVALEIRSPLDGIVVTWDLQRQLAGRPVKRGDALLTVADTGDAWELLLEIPDRAVGHVLAARSGGEHLPVSFQLGTRPGDVGRGLIASISPATEISDESRPAVRARVELKQAPEAFRPGATVVARIHCGRRSLGYVWLHELWEAIRLRLFI